MNRKKVVIVLVEGVSDERALSSITKYVKEIYDIHIHFTNGDIFTKKTGKAVKAVVGDEIKKVIEITKYLKEDILAVIQITDTDGVFINEEFITVDASIGDKVIYSQDFITVSNQSKATSIKHRNKEKSMNLKTMSTTSLISKLPYYLLYFSCNLDHVIHDNCSLLDELKTQKAREFNKKFRENPSDFYNFFNKGTFVVNGSNKDSWEFIQKDKNSLGRFSNFHLIFNILDSLHSKD